MTPQEIRAMFPNAGIRIEPHLDYIGPALEEGRITTPERIAAFMAQLAHESGEYRYMEEIADGSEYEGRADLGNTEPGDGVKFKGHGPMQITGRANHKACGDALGLDLIANPRLICEPANATRSAVWFWNSRKLSLLADVDWFKEITRRINGGYNGLADRLSYWRRNRALLALLPVNPDDEREKIIAWQEVHGLMADGAVGPRTMAALEKAAEHMVAA